MLRAFSLSLLLLAFSAAGSATYASTFTILYSFCGQSQCADGSGGVGVANGFGNLLVAETSVPGSPVIYGTAQIGGADNDGVVFRLVPNGDGSYGEYVLYDFSYQPGGGSPFFPSLVFGGDGNLYGTTPTGGNERLNCVDQACGEVSGGVIFQLTPGDPRFSATNLYEFCARTNCADGAFSLGPLTLGPAGKFFGMTENGGKQGWGSVFKWSPSGGERVLHSFSESGVPNPGLARNAEGDLFGTAGPYFGESPGGIVYQLAPGRRFTALYSFCAMANCADGSLPNGGLLLDGAGNLYGTTQAGGACGSGEVFQLSPAGELQILHSFCRRRDGANPNGGLVRDKAGNLYGTTISGGAIPGSGGDGTIFELVRSDAAGTVTYQERVLWKFERAAATANCSAEHIFCLPANLAIDGAGNLYGTITGGANFAGAVFKLTP